MLVCHGAPLLDMLSLLNLIDWVGGGPALVPFYLSTFLIDNIFTTNYVEPVLLKKSMQIRLDILYYKRDAASIRLNSLAWHVA